jgi:hypothetical protein
MSPIIYPHLYPLIKKAHGPGVSCTARRNHIFRLQVLIPLVYAMFFASFMSFPMLLHERIPTIRFTELQSIRSFPSIVQLLFLHFHVSLERTPL